MSQARSYDFLGNPHVETGRIPVTATGRQDGVYREIKEELKDWQGRATALYHGMDGAADADVTGADLANALYLASQLSSDVHFPEDWTYDEETGVPLTDRPRIVDMARDDVHRDARTARRAVETYGAEVRAGELFAPLVTDGRASDPLVDLVGFMSGATQPTDDVRDTWSAVVAEYMAEVPG